MTDRSPLSLIQKIDKKNQAQLAWFLFKDNPIKKCVCRKSLDSFLLGS